LSGKVISGKEIVLKQSRLVVSAVVVLACGVAGISRAGTAGAATEPTKEELQQQLNELKAKVAELERRQSQQTSTAPATATASSPTQADGALTLSPAQQVQLDAGRRSHLMDVEGFTAGYKNGKFLIQSADGNFVFHPWLQLQFRNVTNWRENGKGPGDDDLENGFELRRVKLGFDGNLFSPDMTYLFDWATDRNSGQLILEEAWARYQFTGDWAVRGGQLKDPFAHESLVSSKRLLAVERSLLNDTFTGGDNFVQGVTLMYQPGGNKGGLRVEGAFTDGAKNNFNQNFQDFPTTNADFGGAVRAEYKVFGDWAAYDQFTALGVKNDLLVLGAGADFTEIGHTNVLLQTLDAQYATPNGLAVYAAYLGRYTADGPPQATPVTGPATTTADYYDWGFLVQGSYLIRQKWEPFVRYDYMRLSQEGLAAGANGKVSEITAGVNWYVVQQAAKLTLDFTYLPNGTPIADSGADILANNDDSEFLIRAQFQLLL
jgi:hypothetical protein